MHTGAAYHDFILSSTRDRKVRQRFQRFALEFLHPQATILDFGAGTGIDAKIYAARGHSVFVYEPAEAMRTYLTHYCCDEIAQAQVTLTDLTATNPVQMITANFAVLNLIADLTALFEKFRNLVVPNGFVLVNLLNPFFLGDAIYPWWRQNLGTLLKRGTYCVEGDAGGIYRFSPSIVARAAQPGFREFRIIPTGMGLATHRYIFMLFQKN